jgi:hypothetical protein
MSKTAEICFDSDVGGNSDGPCSCLSQPPMAAETLLTAGIRMTGLEFRVAISLCPNSVCDVAPRRKASGVVRAEGKDYR